MTDADTVCVPRGVNQWMLGWLTVSVWARSLIVATARTSVRLTGHSRHFQSPKPVTAVGFSMFGLNSATVRQHKHQWSQMNQLSNIKIWNTFIISSQSVTNSEVWSQNSWNHVSCGVATITTCFFHTTTTRCSRTKHTYFRILYSIWAALTYTNLNNKHKQQQIWPAQAFSISPHHQKQQIT